VSLGPRAIGIGEMALRIVARPGAWFALLAPPPEVSRVADQLSEEIAVLGTAAPKRADASAGAASLVHEAGEAGALVSAGFEKLNDEEWRHLDLWRSQLVRDDPVVLILSMAAFERLMRNAPNVASLLGGAVWALDAEAELLTDEEKDERLRALRARFGLSDAEMLARVEHGEVPLDAHLAEWLVLLGRGDLLGHA
jgi:hypothetical protein